MLHIRISLFILEERRLYKKQQHATVPNNLNPLKFICDCENGSL